MAQLYKRHLGMVFSGSFMGGGSQNLPVFIKGDRSDRRVRRCHAHPKARLAAGLLHGGCKTGIGRDVGHSIIGVPEGVKPAS